MPLGFPPIRAALISAAFLFAGLAGCGTTGAFRDAGEIAAWAVVQGFSVDRVKAGAFELAAYARVGPAADETLTVYIEGDGAPWATPYHPPRDPTPIRPLALALAVADPAAKVLYLGRPCQYLDERALRGCDSTYWTERRFAPEVVSAYEAAIDQKKSALAIRRLRLVGYSGGGVLATLLAARRDDVDSLVTVAAPLALSEWAAWHEATPLTGSLDPARLGENVRLPHGVHLVGEHDKIVPPAIVGQFVRRQGGRVETVAGFDHECCWARDWKSLLGRAAIQENAK